MLYRCVIGALLFFTLFTVQRYAQSADVASYRAGEDYVVLDPPVRTRDSNKIEVVEVFWYGCSHCYNFQPLVAQWKQHLPAGVDFWQSPAIWNNTMRLHARAFYTAQALGVGEKLQQPLFNTLVVQRKPLNNEAQIESLFVDYGVDKEAFRRTFHSFGVDSQVKQAEARTRNYQISSTPEVVVNGNYRVSTRSAGGQAQMLEVVDFLIAEEQMQAIGHL